jgi:multiple sugar transport system substrate-binding protein
MSWWGATPRHEKINKFLDIFESKNPDIKVLREYAAFGDYWPKYNTQISAGNQADISGHVMMSVQEYVDRGCLRPIQDLVDSGKIDIANWPRGGVEVGVVNDKLYCINWGLTAGGFYANAKMIRDAGIQPLPDVYTLQEFAGWIKELQSKLPKGITALENGPDQEHIVETYMRSLGKRFYAPDGTSLGFSKEDLVNYWNIWYDLYKSGCILPPEILAEVTSGVDQEFFINKNKTVLMVNNTNRPSLYIKQVPELMFLRLPRADPKRAGDFFQPTMFGIKPNTQYIDECARLLDAIANDVEGNKIFLAEYGVPSAPDIANMVLPLLPPEQKLFFDYIQKLFDDPTIPPTYQRAGRSATIFDPIYKRVWADIAAGDISIKDGVDRFFKEAHEELAKNKK